MQSDNYCKTQRSSQPPHISSVYVQTNSHRRPSCRLGQLRDRARNSFRCSKIDRSTIPLTSSASSSIPDLDNSSQSSDEDNFSIPKTPDFSTQSHLAVRQEYDLETLTTIDPEALLRKSRLENESTWSRDVDQYVAGQELRSLPSRPKSTVEVEQSSDYACAVQAHNIPATISVLRNRDDVLQTNLTTNVDELHANPAGKYNARRRPCAQVSSAQPPTLKRDTDCTDAIVKLIVCFSTKLVHTIWWQSATTPKNSTSFNGTGVLPLQVFIQETLRRSKTSYSTLQVALFYLILLKPHVKHCYSSSEASFPQSRALQCGRRMFLTALILASKYLQDRNYSTRAWSKISGLPIAEINENERRYLGLIKYNLHMTKETFENWSKIVLTICKTSSEHTAPSRFSPDEQNTDPQNWWICQLRRLTPDLVRDPAQTAAYLASLAPSMNAQALVSESFSAPLESPPSSPEDMAEALSEQHFSSMLSPPADQSSNGYSSSTPAASPSSTISVPSRPYPRNLPTPQSTPGHEGASWSQKKCQSSMRCRASTQALMKLDRQAVNVANLETCPPPKPRSCDVTSARHCSLRESIVSTHGYIASSPESTLSESSICSGRSRSSSISSTSSTWFAPVQQVLSKPNLVEGLANAQIGRPAPNPMYSFYHGINPLQNRFEDEGCVVQLPALNQSLSVQCAPLRFQDEGYGSDGSGISDRDKDLTKEEVALLLASMGSYDHTEKHLDSAPAVVRNTNDSLSHNFQGSGQGRKHKRNRSKTSENLQAETRLSLWNADPAVDVVEDARLSSYAHTNEKELQYPARNWAPVKKPVPNSLQNKRIALQHSSSTHQRNAADLATEYLRDITVM